MIGQDRTGQDRAGRDGAGWREVGQGGAGYDMMDAVSYAMLPV